MYEIRRATSSRRKFMNRYLVVRPRFPYLVTVHSHSQGREEAAFEPAEEDSDRHEVAVLLGPCCPECEATPYQGGTGDYAMSLCRYSPLTKDPRGNGLGQDRPQRLGDNIAEGQFGCLLNCKSHLTSSRRR